MKKKIISFVISSCILSSGLISTNVNAEETSNVCTVIGISGDSVMFDNGCVMEQDIYQKYSGEKNILNYGDVICVSDNVAIAPLVPGQYKFSENSYIKYFGTVSDYYDNIKELTVKENNVNITFEDSDGNSVIWLTKVDAMDWLGYKPGIDPRLLNVGDKISCAVKSSEYYVGNNLNYREEVVLPVNVSFESKDSDIIIPTLNFGTPTIAGDIDLNDEHGIADIVALTKYNASPELYPITDATALANADVNKDGTIDAIDTNILIEMSLGNYESAV